MKNENSRIAFVMERDGEEAAEKYAEQGLAIYIQAAIEDSKYKASIDEYRRFLEKECDKNIKIVVVSDK